jgi:phosphohistidine phosphatase SixA
MRLILMLLSLLLATPAAADAWEAARAPGAVLMMRHALAPGTGDPEGFRLDDCATQRNLNAQGRAQAQAVGRMLAQRGAVPDGVLTSRWCRARETAALLGFGAPQDLPALDSFFADRGQGPAQTAALRAYLAATPQRRLILVTHQVNITALTGVTPASGEIVVLARGRGGAVEVAGRIPPP